MIYIYRYKTQRRKRKLSWAPGYTDRTLSRNANVRLNVCNIFGGGGGRRSLEVLPKNPDCRSDITSVSFVCRFVWARSCACVCCICRRSFLLFTESSAVHLVTRSIAVGHRQRVSLLTSKFKPSATWTRRSLHNHAL